MKRIILILLLVSLTSCGRLVKTQVVECTYPPKPEKPIYYKLDWDYENGKYCLDENGAKNLIRNKIMQDGYETDLEIIIEGKNGK